MTVTRRLCFWLASLVTMVLVAGTAWRADAGGSIVVNATATARRQVFAGTSAVNQRARATAGTSAYLASSVVPDRDPMSEASADPFKVLSFSRATLKAAEAAAAVAPPPPALTAVPIPYRYVGRMIGIDGKQAVYLSRADQLISIREHQVLEEEYRIDAIGDSKIFLTYLPSNEKVELPVRSAEN